MIATTFTSWQTGIHPPRSTCSPNLIALQRHLAATWGMTSLGCHQARPIRGGSTPSSHGWGAALDTSYGPGDDRRHLAETVVIPWLIDHSDELGIDAIHDYRGGRIWHAGRSSSTADAHTGWWRASTVQGMGQAWATYLHIEVHPTRWADSRAITDRFPPPPPPPPVAIEEDTVQIVQPWDGLAPDPAIFVRTGHLVEWIADGERIPALVAAGATLDPTARPDEGHFVPHPVPRSSFAALTLVGPLPDAGATTAADFARHHP